MSRSRKRHGGGPLRVVQAQPSASVVRRGETIDLGEMGGTDDREPVTATLMYFGTRYRVNPDLSELDIIDFLENGSRVKMDDPQSLILLKDFVRRNIHPEDFEAFWVATRAHRRTVDEVIEVMWRIIEGCTANPTGRRSDSADGPPATQASSPPAVSPQDASNGDSGLRGRYLKHIERYEAQGTPLGVAMAAQIAVAAEARGVDVSRDLEALSSATA